jgi:hypothetical protein
MGVPDVFVSLPARKPKSLSQYFQGDEWSLKVQPAQAVERKTRQASNTNSMTMQKTHLSPTDSTQSGIIPKELMGMLRIEC